MGGNFSAPPPQRKTQDNFPGDLIHCKEGAMDVTGTPWERDAANPTQWRQSRAMVVCAADWIIPGHGPKFQVLLLIF